MPTKQPKSKWKFLANLGDRDPLAGAYLIFKDETGVYQPEGVYLAPYEVESEAPYLLRYRFELTRQKMVKGRLVQYDLPLIRYLKERLSVDRLFPKQGPFDWLPEEAIDDKIVEKYAVWFDSDLDKVASFMGVSREDLANAFTSADVLERARAYEAIGAYFGFDNLDSYPKKLTEKDVVALYPEAFGGRKKR